MVVSADPLSGRKASIDQFRGFAIFGMILVNYLGYFEAIPETFKHPRYGMTFANAIAPFFLIAVGMGFRISVGKLTAQQGFRAASFHIAKRNLILILIGFILYGPDVKTDIWDALVDIGFAGLLALPLIRTSRITRAVAAFGFLSLYQLLFIFTEYGKWTMANSIDGGPLGPLSWTAILLFGTILYDFVRENPTGKFIRKTLITGILLVALGQALSMLQPPDIWQYSQRSMTMAYPLVASGIGFLTFLLFFLINDHFKIELPQLTVLGINPLFLYILQNVLIDMHGDLLPSSAPIWQALSGFLLIYLICYLVAHYLWRNRILIKL